MADRSLKPLFIIDATATGALLFATLAGVTGAGLEAGGAMGHLYAIGGAGAVGAVLMGVGAALLTPKLSEDGLRRGVRILVVLFLLTWAAGWIASKMAG